MLVISRKKDEDVLIGDNIVVRVVEVRGDKVRLGFEAPKEVPIDRHEVREAKRRGVTTKQVAGVETIVDLREQSTSVDPVLV